MTRGTRNAHAAKPRTKCMSEVKTLPCHYFVTLTRINRLLSHKGYKRFLYYFDYLNYMDNRLEQKILNFIP